MIEEKFKTLPKEYHDRIPKSESILYTEGTPECPNGTRGRIAVTEAVEITDEIERLILNNPTEEAIYNEARKHGFIDMKEDALIKALEHKIPFEEVNTLGGAFMDAQTEEDDTAPVDKIDIETDANDV